MSFDPPEVSGNVMEKQLSTSPEKHQQARSVMTRFYKSIWNFIERRVPANTNTKTMNSCRGYFINQFIYKYLAGYNSEVAPRTLFLSDKYNFSPEVLADLNHFLYECGVKYAWRKKFLLEVPKAYPGKGNGNFGQFMKNFSKGQKRGHAWYRENKEHSDSVWLGHLLAFKCLYPKEKELKDLSIDGSLSSVVGSQGSVGGSQASRGGSSQN